MNSKNLRAEDLDRLGQALLTLTKELWVTRDRLRVLEAVLVDAGALVPEAVDTFQPDEELAAQLESERAQLINQLLETLTLKSDDS